MLDLGETTEQLADVNVDTPFEIEKNGQLEAKLENESVSLEPPSKKVEIESRDTSEERTETPPIISGPPTHEIVGGSSIRRYLNQHLTKYVLEGLKQVADEKPQDPLIFLGEFLIKKGKEQKKLVN